MLSSSILTRADKILNDNTNNVITVFEKEDLEKCTCEVVYDVDSYFNTNPFKNDCNSLSIVKYIESAEFLCKDYYIDRFGMKIPISELSTGSKAALLVYSNPSVIINMAEAGNKCIRSSTIIC